MALLQDKREKGLQEIQRLTKMFDSLRSGGNGESSNSSRVPVTQSKQPPLNKKAINTEFLPVKKALDQLYKEIVITLSNQKIAEANEEPGKKSLSKDGLPGVAEGLIRIEKKVNDVNLLVLEFIDYLDL